MSVLGDAYKALAAVVTIEERVRGLAGKIDKVADQVGAMSDRMSQLSERLTRLETIIEVTRPDGARLRIAPRRGGKASRLPGTDDR